MEETSSQPTPINMKTAFPIVFSNPLEEVDNILMGGHNFDSHADFFPSAVNESSPVADHVYPNTNATSLMSPFKPANISDGSSSPDADEIPTKITERDGGVAEHYSQTLDSHPNLATVPDFLCKLVRILEEGNEEFIQWDDGKINLVDPSGFETNVLPRYFKHSNFSSFSRQMCYFAFRKISGLTRMSPCIFVNDKLTSNLSSLLTIQRRKTSIARKKDLAAKNKMAPNVSQLAGMMSAPNNQGMGHPMVPQMHNPEICNLILHQQHMLSMIHQNGGRLLGGNDNAMNGPRPNNVGHHQDMRNNLAHENSRNDSSFLEPFLNVYNHEHKQTSNERFYENLDAQEAIARNRGIHMNRNIHESGSHSFFPSNETMRNPSVFGENDAQQFHLHRNVSALKRPDQLSPSMMGVTSNISPKYNSGLLNEMPNGVYRSSPKTNAPPTSSSLSHMISDKRFFAPVSFDMQSNELNKAAMAYVNSQTIMDSRGNHELGRHFGTPINGYQQGMPHL